LKTAPSGRFTCDVEFTINNQQNAVWVLLISADGTQTQLGYWYGHYIRNHQYLTTGHMPIGTYHARFSSTDGKTWHTDIGGMAQDLVVNDVPVSIYIAARNNGSATSPPTVKSVTFVSTDSLPTPTPTPTATPTATPTPTPTPTPAPSSNLPDPGLDPKEIQNFYDNVYPLIGSPYDTVTYNPDGSYKLTPGYPTSSTYLVEGTVTSAADGSPIEGASVLLGDSLQKTDSAGMFSFSGIASGVADIAVSADGFAAKTQSIDVNADVLQNFALDKVAAGGSTVANAANETVTAPVDTNVTMPANATVEPTAIPSPTQTQSPGFEGIVAAIAMIGAASALVYMNRKR
jgi:hypothetical protein